MSTVAEIELGLAVTRNISFAVGVNNGGQTVYNFPPTNSPYGINGGIIAAGSP